MALLPGYTIEYKGKNRKVRTPKGDLISYGAYRNIVSQQKGFESRYAETKAGKEQKYTSASGYEQIAHDIGKPRDLDAVITGLMGQYDDSTGVALVAHIVVITQDGTEVKRYIQSSMYQNDANNLTNMLEDIQATLAEYEIAKLMGYFVVFYPPRNK